MFTQEPLIPAGKENLFHLAPIPVFMKVFNDHSLHDEVYDFGLNSLSERQKLMGQELPERYDENRQEQYKDTGYLKDAWVEDTERNAIGSRYWVPPNDFLTLKHKGIEIINDRIKSNFLYLVDSLGFSHNKNPEITESWAQYYDPYSGRGHNQHSHSRWHPNEEPAIGFSGGYYLSDGEPVKDHPYSGAFAFHIRGLSYFLRPKKGMLIIWPNDIVHSVKPFYGKKHRCVINFNIQLNDD
ncbi:MAG: hypothetical protein H0X62_00855 [Bacteroidetes bacterium]|nr:hypothetical protein [Bacteroidota bacterium]